VEQVVSARRHDAVLCRCHRDRRSSMSCPVHPVGPPMDFGQRNRWAMDYAGSPIQQQCVTTPHCCHCPIPQMSMTTASPISHRVVATARRGATRPQRDGGTASGAGQVDDIDGNEDGRRRGLGSGDDGIGVWADANVVVFVMDEDCGGRGQRHAVWIKQMRSLH
jgi:hypothetical protein